MGHVVVRAPRRLQDINSVILPSLARRPSRKIPLANRFFSSKIPRANRGSFLPEIVPPQYPMSPPLPHRYGMSTDSVFALLPRVYSDDHFQQVQIFLSVLRQIHCYFKHTNLQTSSNQINPNVQKVILSTNISTMVTK